MKTKTVTIENLPDDLPDDVLLEHLSVAVRTLVKTRPVVEPPKPNVKLANGGYLPGAIPTYPWSRPQPYPVYRDVTAVPKLARGGFTTSKSTNTANVSAPRSHPFEGPEVFDDEVNDKTASSALRFGVKLEEPLLGQITKAIGDDFPFLQDLFRAKREEPAAEGDWQLPKDDKVGDDVE